ncbi:MAG: hypothetical protein ACE365_03235 [Gammaproteobacteria bacterium]
MDNRRNNDRNLNSVSNDLLRSLDGIGKTVPRLNSWEFTRENKNEIALHYTIDDKPENMFLSLEPVSMIDDVVKSALNERRSSEVLSANPYSTASFRSVMVYALTFLTGVMLGNQNKFPSAARGLVSGLVFTGWFLIFAQSGLSFWLNHEVKKCVKNLRGDMRNNNLSSVSFQLNSLAARYYLEPATSFFLETDPELKSYLLYCKGKVEESQSTYGQALSSYEEAFDLARSEDNRFSIAKLRYDLLSKNAMYNASSMRGVVENLSSSSMTYFHEWKSIYQKIQEAEIFLKENRLEQAYDHFNTIQTIGPFFQKIYPRLSACYFRLQAIITLLGGLGFTDQINESDRFKMPYQSLKTSILCLEDLFDADANKSREMNLQIISQLERFLPESYINHTGSLTSVGMYHVPRNDSEFGSGSSMEFDYKSI